MVFSWLRSRSLLSGPTPFRHGQSIFSKNQTAVSAVGFFIPAICRKTKRSASCSDLQHTVQRCGLGAIRALWQRIGGQEGCSPGCLPGCGDLKLILVCQISSPPVEPARWPDRRWFLCVTGRNKPVSTAALPIRPQPSVPEVYPFREADHQPFVPEVPYLRLGVVIDSPSALLAPGTNPGARCPGFVPR